MINKCGFLILVKNYIFITIAKKNLSDDFFFLLELVALANSITEFDLEYLAV